MTLGKGKGSLSERLGTSCLNSSPVTLSFVDDVLCKLVITTETARVPPKRRCRVLISKNLPNQRDTRCLAKSRDWSPLPLIEGQMNGPWSKRPPFFCWLAFIYLKVISLFRSSKNMNNPP